MDQLYEWKTIGFQLIVDEDVKDLMEQFQNDKPMRDEIEKIMERHSTRNRTFFSERMDTFQNVVLSELQGKLSISDQSLSGAKNVSLVLSSCLIDFQTKLSYRLPSVTWWGRGCVA